MPMPVSRTAMVQPPPGGCVTTRVTEPFSVNLMAFDTRLVTICCTLAWSLLITILDGQRTCTLYGRSFASARVGDGDGELARGARGELDGERRHRIVEQHDRALGLAAEQQRHDGAPRLGDGTRLLERLQRRHGAERARLGPARSRHLELEV